MTPDEYGCALFGKVIEGMDAVDRIDGADDRAERADDGCAGRADPDQEDVLEEVS